MLGPHHFPSQPCPKLIVDTVWMLGEVRMAIHGMV